MIKRRTTLMLWLSVTVTTVRAGAAVQGLQAPADLTVEIKGEATPRLQYAARRLRENLGALPGPARIVLNSDKLEKVEGGRTPEGFHLSRDPEGSYRIDGHGDSGTLYGALALIDRVREAGRWPRARWRL